MSTYMTLEEYASTLKVGDEVTIKYYSITGEKEIKEKNFKNHQKRDDLFEKQKLQGCFKI